MTVSFRRFSSTVPALVSTRVSRRITAARWERSLRSVLTRSGLIHREQCRIRLRMRQLEASATRQHLVDGDAQFMGQSFYTLTRHRFLFYLRALTLSSGAWDRFRYPLRYLAPFVKRDTAPERTEYLHFASRKLRQAASRAMQIRAAACGCAASWSMVNRPSRTAIRTIPACASRPLQPRHVRTGL